MENVKKNQIILVSTVVMLLLTVIITSVVLVIKKRNDVTIETKAKFKQIYASDYDLHVLGDNYYFGTYDNKISVFIDNNGKELYKCLVELAYDGIYKTKDNKYFAKYEFINLANGKHIEFFSKYINNKYLEINKSDMENIINVLKW